jgi:hypothetical protein
MTKIIVIGAVTSGLFAAALLAKEGYSVDEENWPTNSRETFEEKFVIWNIFETGLWIRFFSLYRQPLFTIRHGLYTRTFYP